MKRSKKVASALKNFCIGPSLSFLLLYWSASSCFDLLNIVPWIFSWPIFYVHIEFFVSIWFTCRVNRTSHFEEIFDPILSLFYSLTWVNVSLFCSAKVQNEKISLVSFTLFAMVKKHGKWQWFRTKEINVIKITIFWPCYK